MISLNSVSSARDEDAVGAASRATEPPAQPGPPQSPRRAFVTTGHLQARALSPPQALLVPMEGHPCLVFSWKALLGIPALLASVSQIRVKTCLCWTLSCVLDTKRFLVQSGCSGRSCPPSVQGQCAGRQKQFHFPAVNSRIDLTV